MQAFGGSACPEHALLSGSGGIGLALLAAACSGPPGAGRTLGDDLGTFRVVATQTENTCGPGALGSSQSFDFALDLSREHSELFWNGNVRGRIDASLAFEFRAEVRIELRAPRNADPGCTLRRSDEMTGVLEEEPAAGIIGFTGAMSYSVSSETAEGCTAIELAESGLPVVPCRLEYMLTAERERVPTLKSVGWDAHE